MKGPQLFTFVLALILHCTATAKEADLGVFEPNFPSTSTLRHKENHHIIKEIKKPLVDRSNWECQGLRLGRDVYVSSYLPKRDSPLSTSVSPTNGDIQDRFYIPDDILYTRRLETVAQRFDRARRKVLGKESNLQETLEKNYHEKDALGWMGVCNQWSASSLNPEIAKVLSDLDDVICGDTIFTPGEIRELFTQLYFGGGHDYTGVRDEGDAYKDQVSTFFGTDDFSAQEFDQVVARGLKSGTGVVMDMDKGPQIWNHPVVASEKCQKPITTELTLLEEVPLQYITSSDSATAEVLQQLGEADRIFHEESTSYRTKKTYIEANKQAVATTISSLQRYKHLLTEEEWSAKSYFSLRKLLIGKIVQNQKADFKIKNNLRAVRVNQVIQYKTESMFPHLLPEKYGKWFFPRKPNASSSANVNQKDLDYVLIVDEKGKTVDSRWLSPAKARPDFAWFPNKALSEGVNDLIELLRKCMTVQEYEFTARLQKVIEDKKLSYSETLALQSLLYKMAPGRASRMKAMLKSYSDIDNMGLVLGK